MTSSNDPYKALGLNPGASQEEIKSAYRTLAKKYHPDRYADNPLKELADDKMRKINSAYDELTKSGYSGGAQYRPNPGYQHQNPYGGSQYTVRRKWPIYYYIVIVILLVVFSLGGSLMQNLAAAGTQDNSSSYGQEYNKDPGADQTEAGTNDPSIDYVMAGTLNGYPNITISDAVTGYLSGVSWDHYQDQNGQDVVTAKGYVDSDRNQPLSLYFVYDDTGSIELALIENGQKDPLTSEQLANYTLEIFGSGSPAQGQNT